MIVGIPKEIKDSEHRVGLTPDAVQELISSGHKLLVQTGAGENAKYSDECYKKVGATLIQNFQDIYSKSDLIIKVKEPLANEIRYMKKGQIIFGFFHFAASKEMTEALLKAGVVCIAYEMVQLSNGEMPILTPMSEIAGRMAVQQIAKCLESPSGGSGILLSGIPGVRPATILILGGGVVGYNCALVAAGMGATVFILDVRMSRLRYLKERLPKNCTALICSENQIVSLLPMADAVVGAVLIPGERTPHLLKRKHLRLMKSGSVVLDVSVDQGGCIETCSPTSHSSPCFTVDGILHYCVSNMPGAVPYTASIALSSVVLPYVKMIADKGWVEACKLHEPLAQGLSIAENKVICPRLSKCFQLPCTNFSYFLNEHISNGTVE